MEHGESPREPTGGRSAPADYARLVLLGEQHAVWDLLRPTTLIGSAETCHVRLAGGAVAPLHALITFDAGTLRLRDLASPAGTNLNGAAIDVRRLRDGDQLEIGTHALRVETSLARRKLGGLLVDQYQVRQIIAAGGMSWVYLADDLQTRQPVALKMLPKNHKPRLRIRFELEARAGLRLDHPNVVRTLRLDHTEDVYYLVMEFFAGISLQELVARGGPLEWHVAASVIAQIAEGLSHAHAQGLVHRDVKPANLLVDGSGHAKLVDFGLALLTGEELELSLAEIFGQQLVGTPDYVAPEQSLNSFGVDARADIFSLGATMYFALTGKIPFPAETRVDRLRARHLQPARPLAEDAPSVPPAVAAIVERMMAKEPAARFGTAAEVAAALTPFAQRQSIEFDYADVLQARLSNVRQRTAAMRELKGVLPRSAGSSVSGSSTASSATEVAATASQPIAAEQAHSPRPAVKSQMPADLELERIVAAWPNLPAHARRVMLALIKADHESRKSDP